MPQVGGALGANALAALGDAEPEAVEPPDGDGAPEEEEAEAPVEEG